MVQVCTIVILQKAVTIIEFRGGEATNAPDLNTTKLAEIKLYAEVIKLRPNRLLVQEGTRPLITGQVVQE